GGSRLAIVTLDLGSMVSEKLPREISSKLGIPTVLLAASHTHSAPAFLPFGSSPASDPVAAEYLAGLETKIFRVVQQAAQSMFPATVRIGRGSIQLGYNRLLLRDNGRARALFNNLERVPYGPVDPEFVLMRVDDTDGRLRALLVHYAVHPVVLGPTNCKYSADYPGVMQSVAERELPGAQVMFVQGGAGDINPLFMGRSGKEDEDFGVMQKMGELLAAADVAVVHRLPALEDAVGTAFGARIPVKVRKGRVRSKQPGQCFAGDEPEDGLGVVLHHTNTSLLVKAPRDQYSGQQPGTTARRGEAPRCRSRENALHKRC
ncbi:MAG TPA: neutral/alkaline non-lysosomal ceramidase N-terminal domain-containing protein, partial [Methylomirabilota bacterium]|nr:neutral/alkaline non-lysosomal ceramidase N-terminal domain-containing protein [Methylomirabilota bacterium]